MSETSELPVYKVGGVVLRQRKGGGHASDGTLEEHDPVEVLIIRPKPTGDDPLDVPNYALPRGSRQYDTGKRDASGKIIWADIRNAETARLAANLPLEPIAGTMLREMEEEAGIKPADILRSEDVFEMRERTHASSSQNGKSYPIYWYVIWADDAMEASRNPLPDAVMETRWCTLDELDVLAGQGLFSKGYLPVIHDAIEQSLAGRLPPANLRAQQIQQGVSR